MSICLHSHELVQALFSQAIVLGLLFIPLGGDLIDILGALEEFFLSSPVFLEDPEIGFEILHFLCGNTAEERFEGTSLMHTPSSSSASAINSRFSSLESSSTL